MQVLRSRKSFPGSHDKKICWVPMLRSVLELSAAPGPSGCRNGTPQLAQPTTLHGSLSSFKIPSWNSIEGCARTPLLSDTNLPTSCKRQVEIELVGQQPNLGTPGLHRNPLQGVGGEQICRRRGTSSMFSISLLRNTSGAVQLALAGISLLPTTATARDTATSYPSGVLLPQQSAHVTSRRPSLIPKVGPSLAGSLGLLTMVEEPSRVHSQVCHWRDGSSSSPESSVSCLPDIFWTVASKEPTRQPRDARPRREPQRHLLDLLSQTFA